MDDLLNPIRAALRDSSDALADLCERLPHSASPVPGSAWTVREALIHVSHMLDLYAEIACGTPGPIADFSVATVARRNAERIADNPETDPGKLAQLLRRSAQRFLDATEGRPGESPVRYVEFSPTEIALAQLAGLVFGEVVVHGYDVASAVGAPWPVDPQSALLILGSYAPAFALVTNPATTPGHTAGYGIELRGGPRFTIRFTDGAFGLEPPDQGPVDCEISADPVAFLLLATGRVSMWQAIALDLLGAGGERPELALGFLDLFVYP
jgi:uncharacterized protein (TIGR03083 family)